MRYLTLLLLLFALAEVSAQDLKSGGVLKPEQAIMDIRHYTVALEVSPALQSIEGYAEVGLVTAQPTTVLLFDLVQLLAVQKVWVNKKEQPFTHEKDLIRIALATELPAGKATVKIQYAGKPGAVSYTHLTLPTIYSV